MNLIESKWTLGPAGLCEAAGTGPVSSAPVPVQEGARGSRCAAGPSQRLPGQEGMEAQERRCDSPAGTHQGWAGKKGHQKDKNRCKFNSQNYKEPSLDDNNKGG